MSDWTTYKQALAETSEEIRNIIQSDEIAVVIDSIELSTDKVVNRQQLLIVISDFLLDLTDFPTLDATLLQYLDTLSLQEIRNKILALKNGSVSPSVTNQLPVSPVRTMASDMESARGEQVYSSNQDALLQGNQTPTNPDVARWTQT